MSSADPARIPCEFNEPCEFGENCLLKAWGACKLSHLRTGPGSQHTPYSLSGGNDLLAFCAEIDSSEWLCTTTCDEEEISGKPLADQLDEILGGFVVGADTVVSDGAVKATAAPGSNGEVPTSIEYELVADDWMVADGWAADNVGDEIALDDWPADNADDKIVLDDWPADILGDGIAPDIWTANILLENVSCHKADLEESHLWEFLTTEYAGDGLDRLTADSRSDHPSTFAHLADPGTAIKIVERPFCPLVGG